MNYLEIVLIGIALAVDAMIYSFSYGLLLRTQRLISSLRLAAVVGLYQALMPLLGYVGGAGVRAYVSDWDHWLVLLVFTALGGSIIRHAWQGGEEERPVPSPLGFIALMLVGLATSIDALAVGACLALGNIGGHIQGASQLGIAVGIIGLITAICSLLSFHSSRLLHGFPTRWLETLAGLLLMGLGIHNALRDLGWL